MATHLGIRFRAAAPNDVGSLDVTGNPLVSDDQIPHDVISSAGAAIAVSPDGTLMAITDASATQRLRVYDIAGWALHPAVADLPTVSCNKAAFSPDGAHLAVGGSGQINVYETATWTRVALIGTGFSSSETSMSGLFWRADGARLYATNSGTTMRVYETTGWTLLTSVTTTVGNMVGAAISPDGSTIAVFGPGGLNPIKFYETATLTIIGLPATIPSSATVTGAAWSPDGAHFFMVSKYFAEGCMAYSTAGNQADPTGYTTETMDSAVNGYTGASVVGPTYPIFAPHEDAVAFVQYDGSNFYTIRYIRKVAGTWTAIGDGTTTAMFPRSIGGQPISYGLAFYDPPPPGPILGELEDTMDVADAGDGLNLAFNTESVSVSEAFIVKGIMHLLDEMALTDTATANAIYALIERVGVSEQLTGHATLVVVLSEALALADQFKPSFRAEIVESLNAADTIASLFGNIALLIDQVRAVDATASRLSAAAALAMVAVLSDQFATLTIAQIIEALEADDTLAGRLLAHAVLIETVDATMAALAGRTAVVGLVEAVSIDEGLTAFATLHALLADSVALEVELVILGEIYQGWVVNTENLAPSEYDNFNFNSMTRIGQSYFGANESGLFRLGGDSDAGDPIQARIQTGEMDFGSPQLKRVERAYIGYTTSGDLALKVIATVEGKKTEFWYLARKLRTGEVTETRVPIGRGLASRYWQFELVNQDGADFELDRIDLQVLNLSRRI